MLKKILIGVVIVVIAAAGLAYLNRASILKTFVLKPVQANQYTVAEHVPVSWQQGPSVAAAPIEERPPNIVFILLDDLGINDLSTFGGGVAAGRVPTPNIDKLATDGALFSLSLIHI